MCPLDQHQFREIRALRQKSDQNSNGLETLGPFGGRGFLLPHGPQCSDSVFSFLVLENVKAETVLKDDLAQLVRTTDKCIKAMRSHKLPR